MVKSAINITSINMLLDQIRSFFSQLQVTDRVNAETFFTYLQALGNAEMLSAQTVLFDNTVTSILNVPSMQASIPSNNVVLFVVPANPGLTTKVVIEDSAVGAFQQITIKNGGNGTGAFQLKVNGATIDGSGAFITMTYKGSLVLQRMGQSSWIII